MDLVQLVFVGLGASMYMLMHMPMRQRLDSPSKLKPLHSQSSSRLQPLGSRGNAAPRKVAACSGSSSAAWAAKVCADSTKDPETVKGDACCSAAVREDVSAPGPVALPSAVLKERSSTVRPVQPLAFLATGFDAQVQELLARITPTAQTDKVVSDLADAVKQQLSGLVQDMEVLGFAGSELMRGTAFGVAVPEVDIVACMSLRSVSQCFRGRVQQPPKVSTAADMLKIQKKAVRLFTEHLVRDGRFKFRRSAFRGAEPKVTLLASAELGVHGEPIPFDLSFNSTSPMYNTAFLAEAGKLEPRAKALALLVKRWAKDRAMCHATKGHLSPYAWTLLTIFFLQVGLPEEGPLLPPLTEFDTFHSLAQKQGQAPKPQKKSSSGAASITVGELFRRFVDFYGQDLDYQKEAVDVLHGRRGPPDGQLPLNIIVNGDGSACVGPSIVDPFNADCNLASGMNEAAWQHLREELARARSLLAAGAMLPELLEPWSRAAADDAEDADEAVKED
eukprot:SRR837773.17760.p1 GENE.SRR837773.17760~~SRR837773.17760.p1  ORF type:complete len:529 (-),score=113.44 SRR837773.17760:71-1582(-)